MSDKNALYDELASKAYPYRQLTSIYMVAISSLTILVILPLLIVVYKYNNRKKCIDLTLCTILLYSDLICSTVTLTNSLCAILYYKKYISNQYLCNLVGVFNFVPYTISINLMGIISFERCLKIVYEREYSYKFYFSMLLSFIIVSLINAIQTPLTNGFFILPNAIYCLFDPSTTGGLIGSIITGLSCGTAYTLIIVCYLTICVYRRNISQKAQLDLGLNPKKVRQEVNTTIIKSLSIMVASLSTSGVYVSIMVISWFHPAVFTNVIDMVQVIFIEPQMLINVVILLNMKPDLWKGLKKIYGFNSE